MSQTVWRIASDTPDYEADDLAGKGAEQSGGRWNEKGVPMVYASESRALACLETVVHLNAGAAPFNRYLVAIEIPEDIWAKALEETAASLSVGWDAEPAGRVSIASGTIWVRGGTSAVLVVPSVIVPEECNILVNPSHTDSRRISARKLRRWMYDPRLRTAP